MTIADTATAHAATLTSLAASASSADAAAATTLAAQLLEHATAYTRNVATASTAATALADAQTALDRSVRRVEALTGTAGASLSFDASGQVSDSARVTTARGKAARLGAAVSNAVADNLTALTSAVDRNARTSYSVTTETKTLTDLIAQATGLERYLG